MRQHRCLAPIFAVGLTFVGANVATADVLISVNKAAQELTVFVNGAEQYRWPVSTARAGYVTPNGAYRPIRLDRTWFSRKYGNSPMPYSIFFHGGYAIHGSYERREIGYPASHGCVRLDPKNAERLFELVKAEGPDKTRIVIDGSAPSRDRLEARLRPEPHWGQIGDEPRGRRLPAHVRLGERSPVPAPTIVQIRTYVDPSPQLVDPFSELLSYVQNHSR